MAGAQVAGLADRDAHPHPISCCARPTASERRGIRPMNKLTIDDLYSLETYARLRPEFRERVIEHKAHRRLALGAHLSLAFEDRLTMHYQVQEMLRAERIFEPADIEARTGGL